LGFNDEQVEDLKNHVYLAYARCANALGFTNHGVAIVQDFVNGMSNVQSAEEEDIHFSALSNAGSAVPLEIHTNILNSDLALSTKVNTIRALSNRLDESEDTEVTQFIHSNIYNCN
jgi:hypothetical protein